MKPSSRQLQLLPAFKKFIASSVSGIRVTNSGKRITSGSILQYKCVEKLLAEYEDKYQVQLRIMLMHRCSLRQVQSERLYWKRFFKAFTNFLYNYKGYYDEYAASVVKIIRTFFNYIKADKCLPIGDFHKQFRIPAQALRPVVLEPHQLKFLIFDKAFEAKLSKYLQRAKYIFVFGCTVGLRFSDLQNLQRQNLQESGTCTNIILHTGKTNADVRIPLPGYAVEIIRRYNKKGGRFILPRISCSNLNIQLKLLMEKAGYTYNLPKIRFRQGKAVEIKNSKGGSFRFCDHIGTHTMRRTAITTLLTLGVEENTVRRISGHAPGSKEFYKYVALVQDYLDQSVMAAHDRLMNLELGKV